MRFTSLLSCALLATANGAPAPADSTKVEFSLVPPAVVQQRLELVPKKLSERRAILQRLFEDVGCVGDQFSEERVPHSKEPNLICTLPGDSTGTIVVGGHFDAADIGAGAVDDWSGAALLPSLYESLKSQPRHHRFVFIGFAAEEQGLVGSAEYVKGLSKEEKAGIRGMINLECLGLTPPKVWASRADRHLLDLYWRVAGSLHLELVGVNVERVGDDDSHAFMNAKIPVITLHSVTEQTFGTLHSKRDNLAAIHPEDYYSAYRLAATYLAYLDTTLQ